MKGCCIQVISSASAGGWFFSLLAYSPSYLNLTRQMAETPTAAGELYWSQYLEKFLLGLGIDPKASKIAARELADGPGPTNAKVQDVVEIMLEWAWATQGIESKDWNDFIQVLLTAGHLTGQEYLGSPVNPWASGKTWLAGTSFSTPGPGGKGPGTCHDNPNASGFLCLSPSPLEALVYGNTTQNSLSYSCEGNPPWTPARFSVVMGSGRDQDSPLSTCPSCDGIQLKYTHQATTAPIDSVMESPIWNSNLPLVDAVSSSSAFLGLVLILPFFDAKDLKTLSDHLANLVASLPFLDTEFQEHLASNIFKFLTFDWTMWCMTASSSSSAFRDANELVEDVRDSGGKLSPKGFKNLAQQRLMGLADGTYTDNSGIAHAVSSGAQEIIYLGLTSSGDMARDLYRLCGGEKSDLQVVEVADLNFCPFCEADFQVFKEDVSALRKTLEEVSQLFEISSQASTLTSMRVASVNLTTVQSSYFDIEADRAILLHMVVIESPLYIGGWAYSDYATFVQDIIDTFQTSKNQHLVKRILSWFRPQSGTI